MYARSLGRYMLQAHQVEGIQMRSDYGALLTEVGLQFILAYHSILYRHKSMPLPMKSATHIKTFPLRGAPFFGRNMNPTKNKRNFYLSH